MNGNILLRYLPAYRGNETIIKHNQDTNDIIKGIIEGHDKYAKDYDKISSFFIGSTPKQTARNIWNFLKENVNYVVEPEYKQTIKSPSAIIATGKTTGSDCKNYSLMTAGILQSLARKGIQKVPYCFRFSSYKYFSEVPEHVFCVLYPGTKNEIWVDAVLNSFDQKKAYTYKIDKTPKNMLVGISGIGATPKTFFGKILRPVLVVAGSPARTAFLLLVGLNFTGLATNLAKAGELQPAKLKNWWERLGGQISKLDRSIKLGKKKKRIFGVDQIGCSGCKNQVGCVDPSSCTLETAAVASPILAAAATFLKDVLKQAQPALTQISTNLLVKKAQDAAQKIALTKDEKALMAQYQVDEFNALSQQQATSSTVKKFLPIALLAGAGVGIYLITKKKRK